MGIFSRVKRTPTVRKPYKKQSEEDLDKVQKRKQKEFAWNKFVEEAKDNPEVLKRFVHEQMGIKIEDPDPVIVKKREFESALLDAALNQITNNPELLEQYATQKAEEIISGGGRPRRSRTNEGEYIPSGSPLEELVDSLDTIDALKDRLGGSQGSGGGILATLANSEAGKALAEGFMNLVVQGGLASKSGQVQEVPYYIVQMNGEMVKVTETEYKQLMVGGQIQPVGILGTVAPQPKTIKPEVETVSDMRTIKNEAPVIEVGNEDVDKVLEQTPLEELVGYLALSPDEFVDRLREESYSIPRSALLLNFLSSATYDTIYDVFSPYAEDLRVGEYVTKLLENRDWIDKVLYLIQNYEVNV